MALRRRSDRGSSSIIWPGFVDAMTALLLVLMFVLSIFMIVQFILREELSGKDRSLQALTATLGDLQQQLGMRDARIEELQGELDGVAARELELLTALEAAKLEGEDLKGELAARVAELAALTQAFDEQGVELAALEQIAASLRDERDEAQAAFASVENSAERLTELEAEKARLEAERAEIRAALAAAEEQAAQTELTLQEKIAALELAAEQKAKEAEETLTLLAAAEAVKKELDEEALARAAELDKREAALTFAAAALEREQALSEKGREAIALLNSQVLLLRRRIDELSAKLGDVEAENVKSQATIEDLGAQLNAALEKKVDELEAYRSEFFGRLREILGERDDVQIVGDRFIFRSEILFESGSAELSAAGKVQLARFAGALRTISPEIPGEINWILRIDGHTDKVPVSGEGEFASNWELSQARALSVVTYLIEDEGIEPRRLAAAGFGEYQPLDPANTPEAFARNRRIELRFDER